jgi:hypothetical protein
MLMLPFFEVGCLSFLIVPTSLETPAHEGKAGALLSPATDVLVWRIILLAAWELFVAVVTFQNDIDAGSLRHICVHYRRAGCVSSPGY